MIAPLAGAASIFSPIPLALAFWKLGSSSPRHWPFYFLFFPTVLITEWLLLKALSAVMGDDGDGPPGEGFLYAPGFLTTMLGLVIYTVALADKGLRIGLHMLRAQREP